VPDFRSKNGVYELLVDSIYDDPQELFHIDNFKTEPKEFFKQAAKVFPKMQGLVPADRAADARKSADVALVPKYSATHAFLAMLQSKGKLLTNYTQNIDGLEIAAGVSPSKLVQCHGTLSTATCMSCGKKTTARKYMPVVKNGGIPFCKCSLVKDTKDKIPRGTGGKKKRKRHEFEDSDSDDEQSNSNFPKGLLKPDMTFFGEHISFSYAPRLEVDKTSVDLLVIIGTSLQVAPVNDMLLAVPPTVPQIWISKDRCQRQGVKVDIELLGECDVIIEEIARRAGWTAALEERLGPKQSPAPLKSASCKEEKSQVQPRQAKIANERNVGKKLQIRPKSIDMSDKKIVIPGGTLNRPKDEALDKCDPPTKLKSETDDHKCILLDGQGKESKLKPEVGSAANKNAQDANHMPSKVAIELEEGTRSRWYVRRAK
jgi:NAD-dependent SIR2 family protein deacetylase